MARILPALLALTASAGLAGCAYGDWGYGGVSIGVGSGGYYDDYYGYGSYYGWYDDYYYPGAGYYIYDRGGNRHRWNDHHRRHWEGRRDGRDGHENWAGYDRDGDRDGRRDGDWGGRRDGDGNWRGRGDGDRRADRGDRTGSPAVSAPDTAVSVPTGRPDRGWRDGGRDAGRDAWRNAGGEQRGGDRSGNGGGRGERAGRSPEVARQAPEAPRQAPQVAREPRAAPSETSRPAPEPRDSNRQAARRILNGE